MKPFIGAHEYLNGVARWTLWLAEAKPFEIKKLPTVLERVRAVDTFRKASRAKSTREYPYPMLYRQVTQPLTDYILVPAHTSENRVYIPFGFFGPDTIVGNSCFSIPGATLFHYGVIQSAMHMAWVRTTCGRLKSDYRYSKDIVYNNFPWPVDATDKDKTAISRAAQTVLDARASHPHSSLADLYSPLTMPTGLVKAHKALDRIVDAAYVPSGGKRTWTTEADRVAFLFKLHQKLTSLLPPEPPKGRKRKSA